MAGFAFALALDANEIHVEMHIELCYSLSRYRESHLTTINLIQGSSSSLMAGFASTFASTLVLSLSNIADKGEGGGNICS